MDKRFLDKVIDKLVSETRLDYENQNIVVPFLSTPLQLQHYHFLLNELFYVSFSKYCKNIYGLTEEEIEYVWYNYKNIINDKIDG